MKRIAPELEARVLCLYQQGHTHDEIVKLAPVGKTTVLRVLHRNNTKLHGIISRRKYTFNEYAFEPMTPEGAYWLGFLCADGNIRRYHQGWLLQMALANIDTTHLEKFQKFMGSNHPLYPTGNGTTLFSVSSQRIGDVLATYGIRPRKSAREDVLGLETNRDFWRGVIDGDGHFHKYAETDYRNPVPYTYYPWRLEVCGGPLLLNKFLAFLRVYIPDLKSIPRPVIGTHRVQVAGEKVGMILRLLYGNCEVYLDRKYQTALAALNEEICPN